jgi:hypothetical protein
MKKSMHDTKWPAWLRYRTLLLAGLAVTTTACSLDGIVGKNDLPSSLVDPARAKTADGAHAVYITTVALLRDAIGGGLDSYAVITGRLADEGTTFGQDISGSLVGLSNGDARFRPETRAVSAGSGYYALYSALQRVRGQAGQARQLLDAYYPAPANRPLIAHMLASTGYAELLLAEGFCSGVPLSTLDYDGDYTFQPGSPTIDVLQHAIVLFDSAITFADDSARIKNLARVGKGRALLQLGELESAALAVADVPDDFSYDLQFSVAGKACGFWSCTSTTQRNLDEMSDHEGINGLPFRSEWDARIPPPVTVYGTIYPDYAKNYSIRLASGIEAQLIRAEAELASGDANWLTRLNALRTTCTDAATCAAPAPAGLGGVAGLAPLTDPGSDTARVSLLFRERAYWTYLTGHRQGDLRRLIRNYGREESAVYPTGQFIPDYVYGTDVTLPIPPDEKTLNPKFQGCIDRKA